MSTENKIQEFVHKLEAGPWAKWIRRGLLWAAVLYVSSLWMFTESGFKGLSHEKSIEQAQIAREIARGNGFSTKMIRPAALWQFKQNKGSFPLENTPDTYHGPLNPFISSFFLRAVKSSWVMTTKEIVYLSDKVLVAVQLAFFLMAVAVSYLTAKRLFDKRLAVFGMGMLLLAEVFWDFSMSGLPQMLMLFLFSCAGYVMLRAVEAHHAEKSTLGWCALLGLLFGLLALTHALTLFIFVGAVAFVAIALRPRLANAGLMVAVCALLLTPWLIRNYHVCGNAFGVGWYSGVTGVTGTESASMRSMELNRISELTPRAFLAKIREQLMSQLESIYSLLGSILVAPAFFIALLHIYKKPETALFRWGVFSMWAFAALGMSIVGLDGHETVHMSAGLRANDLHVLFIPMMTFYGLAFVLVLWTRLEIHLKIIRIGFMVLLFSLSAMPFFSKLIELHKAPTKRVEWPPYVPPYISLLNQWTKDSEIIMSDMPWAVAWYADRKSLWLPMSIQDYSVLNDYNLLGGRVVGMYLTPVTGNQPLISSIAKGEYKDWAPFILRQANIKDFPLRAVTAMPVDNECVFYSDRDRWSTHED